VTNTPNEDKHTRSEPLDLDDGEDDVVIEEQSVGRPNLAGGVEWPDPDTPLSAGS
jgi:hypothetical protein